MNLKYWLKNTFFPLVADYIPAHKQSVPAEVDSLKAE
jgi:hypothetical protein